MTNRVYVWWWEIQESEGVCIEEEIKVRLDGNAEEEKVVCASWRFYERRLFVWKMKDMDLVSSFEVFLILGLTKSNGVASVFLIIGQNS